MSLFLFHGFPSSSSFTTSQSPKLLCNFNRSTSQLPIKRTPIIASIIPATDRVMDFGRHRGRMLGTLPSKYLKWVSKNLRARDFEEWAKLADEVLQDPVYKDRLEWEFAENILTGDHGSGSLGRTDSSVEELLEFSKRFGWDNDDKLGWSRIDFSLLGTSKGGRIPRKSEKLEYLSENYRDLESRKSKSGVFKEGGEMGGVKGKREVRVERQRLKRGLKMNNLEEKSDLDDQEETVNKTFSPFPGRRALLKKVIDSRRVL